MPSRVPIPPSLEESGWTKGRACKELLLQIVEDSGTVNISYVKERKGASYYEIEAKSDKELRTAKSLLAISLEHNAQRQKILQQKAAYQSTIRVGLGSCVFVGGGGCLERRGCRWRWR